MSKSDPGFTLAYLAHAMLFVNNFYYTSDEGQRRRYLPKVISGEWVGAMGMTEPSGGTDVIGMMTAARRERDGYLLTGRKALIPNAPDADIFLIYYEARRSHPSFVLERGFAGLSTSTPTHKMGMRASTMGEIVMDDCFVPKDNVLGGEGQGIVHMMRNLEIERITLAAMSLGIADRCLEIMVNYARDRQAFGRPLVDFGQIQRYSGRLREPEALARSHPQRQDDQARSQDRSAGRREVFMRQTASKSPTTRCRFSAGACDEFKVERFPRDAVMAGPSSPTREHHPRPRRT